MVDGLMGVGGLQHTLCQNVDANRSITNAEICLFWSFCRQWWQFIKLATINL